MNAPAPSPKTNPARSASNGREALAGPSPSRGAPRPRMFMNPICATSMSGFSVEPEMTAVTSPRLIASAASPSACVPVAQAETTAMLWPRAPVSIAIIPEVLSTKPCAIKVGATLRGPFSFHAIWFSMKSPCPPAPDPKTTPISSRFASVISSPESLSACFAAATPQWISGPVRRMDLGSSQAAGSKFRISPATTYGEYAVGSQCVMRPRPLFISVSDVQTLAVSLPIGETMPSPVMTTRRV